jgi:hypothetical protein
MAIPTGTVTKYKWCIYNLVVGDYLIAVLETVQCEIQGHHANELNTGLNHWITHTVDVTRLTIPMEVLQLLL